MMTSVDGSSELQQLIKDTLSSENTEEQVREFIGRLGRQDNSDVKLAAHSLQHFLDDGDIRRRDQEYDRLMRVELINWLQVLGQLESEQCDDQS